MNYEVFRNALQVNPEAALDLTPDTFRRYASGQLPKSLVWLLRHPKLLHTLAQMTNASSSSSAHSNPPIPGSQDV